MIDILETPEFTKWFKKLKDKEATLRIAQRLDRVASGNFGDFKSLGGGISELKLTYGPGYRVYFTKEGNTIVVLLIGGDKSSQGKDIKKAKEILKGLK